MRAEKTGGRFEKVIEKQIEECGYEKIEKEEMKKLIKNVKIDKMGKDKYYTRNWPLGICLYPVLQRREEFFLYSSSKYPLGLIITAKWQASTGSVYEKAPYILLNATYHHPCPTVLIWDGAFKRSGVKGGFLWLKEHRNDKLIEVFTFSEFLAWSNNGGI